MKDLDLFNKIPRQARDDIYNMADKIKILIVEDDKMLVDMYTMKFESEGYQVAKADNGKTGLDLVRKEKPDIILLDIIMPQMDGFQVLKELKKDASLKNLPVVLLSNLGQTDDVKKGLALGANDYLVKANFTPAQVVDKVKEVLKK